MLDPRFKLKAFKERTNIKGKRRGQNMEHVDQALELYWSEVDNAQPAQQQMSAAYQLLKACNTWLKYKKDKFQGGAGKEHFKTRWDAVGDLAKAAYRECAMSYSTSVSAGALQFESKKFNAAWSPKRSLKALDEPYTHERKQWEKSKKSAYPVSGTSVHETVDRITNDHSMSYDQASANAYGQMKVFAKNFDQLNLKDWMTIDDVMADIETMRKTSLSRHVLFLKKAERIQHMAIIREGKLTKEDGSFWDTGGYQELFVMDEYGNLFIGEGSLGTKDSRLNHSSMLAGKSVLCAGTLNVRQGLLTEFNNNSGHYKPTGEHVYQALQALREDRADLSKAQVTIASSANHGWGPLTVDDVIRNRGVFPTNHPKAY